MIDCGFQDKEKTFFFGQIFQTVSLLKMESFLPNNEGKTFSGDHMFRTVLLCVIVVISALVGPWFGNPDSINNYYVIRFCWFT